MRPTPETPPAKPSRALVLPLSIAPLALRPSPCCLLRTFSPLLARAVEASLGNGTVSILGREIRLSIIGRIAGLKQVLVVNGWGREAWGCGVDFGLPVCADRTGGL
jgi:hypothetical protein